MEFLKLVFDHPIFSTIALLIISETCIQTAGALRGSR